MSIPENIAATVKYLGTDTTNEYDFPFRVEKDSDVEIVITEIATGEQVSFRGPSNRFSVTEKFFPLLGGSISLLPYTPAVDELEYLDVNGFLKSEFSIVVMFADVASQPTVFRNTSNMTPVMVEKSLDRLTMSVKAVLADLPRAMRVPIGTEGNFELPPLAENEKRILRINDNGDGFDYGPTVDQIQGWSDNAQQSAIDAANSAQAAADSAQAAGLSETAAGESALAAEGFKDETEEFKDETAIIRDEAEAYANLFLFDHVSSITDMDSPFFMEASNDSTLFLVNDDDGPVQVIMPDIEPLNFTWHIALMKETDAAGAIIITPYPGQTINGQSMVSLSVKGLGMAFFKETDTNWSTKYLPFTDSGSSLPVGGGAGAALVKLSATDSDIGWDDFVIEGWSTRFNMQWNSAGLRDTLMKILAIVYQAATVALSGSTNVLREKGAVVSSITLSANVAKRSNNIARILFRQGGNVIIDMDPPANTGSGVTTTPYTTPFSDNTTFTVEVTDEVVSGEGGTTVSSSTTYNFVYPYYYGAGAPGRTAAQVASLTKDVINSNANLTRNFTTANGDVYYFAYPASYGVLTSILDENSFEVFGSFTRRVENITGLDGNPVSYNIYESNNPVTAGTTNFTFRR